MHAACMALGAVCASGMGDQALSMVLTDMGNGVTRITEVEMVPLGGDAGEEWCDLEYPLVPRVRDALGVALGILGKWPCQCVVVGRARAISEVAAQVLVHVLG